VNIVPAIGIRWGTGHAIGLELHHNGSVAIDRARGAGLQVINELDLSQTF